ncbi:MAG TPA: 2Fe-2S iron-sulfur cluster-binding protein [Actinophytocola sp.]|nr:2Fe-2S iron-sulfur cluster-binding protein [Actinophytocola sp.]
MSRLAEGGRLDRSTPLQFVVDGVAYTGFRGDTVASALLANGVRQVGSSAYLNRPRGIVAAGVTEPNALLQVGPSPMCPATTVPLVDGLVASTLSGRGRLLAPNTAYYDKKYTYCDVLVVGAGPAGLAAALAAGRSGARVILADEQTELGGSLLSTPDCFNWVAATVEELGGLAETRVLTRATVFGYYDHNYVTIAERRGSGGRLWHVRAGQVVLATGAHERPLVFADNDRPGVMLAGAVRTYLNRYAVCVGTRAVVCTTNDSAYRTALDLLAAGVSVVLADTRDTVPALAEEVRAAGGEVRPGTAVVGTSGNPEVTEAFLAPLPGGPVETVHCDLIAMSGGWDPVVHLHSQARGRLRYDQHVAAFVPDGSAAGRASAGAARGVLDLPGCMADGFTAGAAAAEAQGFTATEPPLPPLPADPPPGPTQELWTIPSPLGVWNTHFVDLQRDATVADVLRATGTGMRSAEHVKRYTTIGTAHDQGKTASINTLGTIAAAPDLRPAASHTGKDPELSVPPSRLENGGRRPNPSAPDGSLSFPQPPVTTPPEAAHSAEDPKLSVPSGSVENGGRRPSPSEMSAVDSSHQDASAVDEKPELSVHSRNLETRGPNSSETSVLDASHQDASVPGEKPELSVPTSRLENGGRRPNPSIPAASSSATSPLHATLTTEDPKLSVPTGSVETGGRRPTTSLAGAAPTTFRPPYTPVPFAMLAGRDRGPLHDPARVTPIHSWHVEHGARFEDVGQWKRAWYFPNPGEDMTAAVLRECRAAREGVGVQDASTLGKIEIVGPDAAVFLNRMYTNAFVKLPVGSARYGLLCKADGMVFDDGVVLRLAEDRFLATTTTGNAAAVLDWFEEWLQTEWPDLRVRLTSVTEQWATIAVVGPLSREVIGRLAPAAVDLGFMTFVDTTLTNGVTARIARISFSGELAFEVNVASWHGLAVWHDVMAAGAEHGITPYGTETMHVLRAEKGYPIVGQDTDGTVTPIDLGMDWIVSKRKQFVGRRSLQRTDTARPDRKHLVGLLPVDPDALLPEGAQLVADGVPLAPPMPMIGHVTSSYRSAALGRTFALALVRSGRDRLGQIVHAPLTDRTIAATVVEPVHYDPEGKRRDG